MHLSTNRFAILMMANLSLRLEMTQAAAGSISRHVNQARLDLGPETQSSLFSEGDVVLMRVTGSLGATFESAS